MFTLRYLCLRPSIDPCLRPDLHPLHHGDAVDASSF
ncbi:hypothetical protein CIPAW_13G026600 [Carya illinoinensis]|uniref:Uncharacterized protein n=1 Tax=Carya illinoinensis TaxID=32201 RepID=A0A8T1NNR1_CARIL|nr:hypothetical protein CIPAW_13G026600 [Carya illinoinensis]